jgi:hypothetical protein
MLHADVTQQASRFMLAPCPWLSAPSHPAPSPSAPQVQRGEVSWVDRRAIRYQHKVEQQQIADQAIGPQQVSK